MAIYYVRPDGNNTNVGTGPATNQAWATIQKALGATGIGSGDTLYIAPGLYGEQVTIGGTYSTTTNIIGDPTASQFSGVSAGRVQIGAFNNLNNAPLYTGATISGTSKNNLVFTSIEFLLSAGGISNAGIYFATSQNNTFNKCVFQDCARSAHLLSFAPGSSNALNFTFRDCVFLGSVSNTISYIFTFYGGGNNTDTTSFTNCAFIGHHTAIYADSMKLSVMNCTFWNQTSGISHSGANPLTVTNTLFFGCGTGAVFGSGTQTYNRFIACSTNFIGAATSATTRVVGTPGVENLYTLLTGIANLQPFSSFPNSPNTSFGTATGAPTTDLYGVAWTGTSPDSGSATYRSLSAVGAYNPTERNASTITIAPGSTSQSIELYLGATGLTASTAGLSAYYNRTRSADVQIPLVARNITQNWTSGGFAEVNANTMPGVYRLDIPNEALAAGADDVTVVVRGASGTNGAVMSIKLSSGGLTTAQTASAVWGALTNDHTTHGTFGWNVLRADQDSKEGLVTLHQSGGISRVDADVHAIANDTAAATGLKGALNHDGTGYVDSDVVRISTSTAAANELEGALLHNGTDYIDSNLLSGNSTRVFVGRFQLTQTGTTQGDIIEAFTTDTPAFELQLFDGDNNIVPVTGATLGLRILDVTSTVVETGTPTIEYGTGGIVRWTAPGSYVSIGCPAGMYRLFVDRTVSGTTTTFGPLQIKVQVQ